MDGGVAVTPHPDPGLGPLWCVLICFGAWLASFVFRELMKRRGKW
jgi:hypothetical protein